MYRTRRVVSAVLAAVLAAAGVIALIEIVHAALGPGWLVVDWPAITRVLARNDWASTGARVAGAILAPVGLALLVLVLGWYAPGRPRWLPAGSRPRATGASRYLLPSTSAFVSRRGGARAARDRLLDVDGVRSARVRIGRRRVRAAVRLRPAAARGTMFQDSDERAARALAASVSSWDLVPARPVRFRVRGGSGGGTVRDLPGTPADDLSSGGPPPDGPSPGGPPGGRSAGGS